MIDDMTVGMENLPNVFIDKIRIESTSNPEVIVMEMTLCFYDKKPPLNSWRLRDEMDIKVHVAYESRPDVISSLNDGQISLFEHVPIEGYYYKPSVRPISINAGPVGLEGEYEKYSIKIRKQTKKTNNLNIYAACFIDGFGFNNPIFDKFYGPMAAERVYAGGQLNTLSNYFYYPDTNQEYGGPVHQKPDGTYMEGSTHREQPHKEVVLVSEENYKIQTITITDFITEDVATTRPESIRTEVISTDIPTPESIPSPTVGIEDPNVPDSPLDRIY